MRGATVIDGTGGAGIEADVAVDGDRIVIVGEVAGTGAEELDGRGLVLAPGWIDTHTHLDANQFWDPFLTPCSRYGVSTVVIANCGYALAPTLTPEQREYVIEALVTVEQVPRDAIDEACRSTGPTKPSYFESLTKVETALNRAFLVGHLPVRAAVMGPEAAHARREGRRDRGDARARRRGLRLGALGFSTDQVVGNIGPRNTALPGQVCDDAELLAVARALGAGTGTGPVHDGAPRTPPRPGATTRRSRMARAARGYERQARGDRAGVRHVRRPGIGHDLLDAMAARHARQPGRRPGVAAAVRAVDATRRARRVGARVLPTLHAAVKDGGGEGVRRLANDEAGMRELPRKATAGAEPDLQRPVGSRARPLDAHAAPISATASPRSRDGAERGPHRSARRHRGQRRLRDAVRVEHAQPRRRPARRPRRAPGGAARRERRGRPHAEQHRQLLRGVDVAALGPRTRGAVARDAIRKLTGRQADLFGIPDRGRVAPGTYADLVLFDPDTSGSTTCATCGQARGRPPARRRSGRDRGERRERDRRDADGESTGARPGRFL